MVKRGHSNSVKFGNTSNKGSDSSMASFLGFGQKSNDSSS